MCFAARCDRASTIIDDKKHGTLCVWSKRIAWLIAIWAASVAALGIVASALHIAMHAAGLSH
ncbi:DUF2474 domain-containing protein [Paraburkholderia lacunae]|uniref:DUF2474 domain-containing protein n=1 Tax=Paraburkholderia lacunae TaxID=2211104 RepID=A0A370MX40_9BURK|nr:DUF2474 domain-containing protein [Paraburkholderia lacunae]RDJ97938.1 DUF2474 domain-containing protein [Paraburkholderia lacunae]